jgi:protein-tyrosine kinase
VELTQHAPDITRLPRSGGSPVPLRETLERPAGEAGRPHARPTSVRIDRSVLDDRPIVMPGDPGPAAHAFRMLRTQLLQRVRLHRARAVGIVSAADGEGKTVTAVNLALSLAVEPNQNVLLVDLDLRRPSVASTLKLPIERGLESWFAGGANTIEEITYAVEGFLRLSIVPTLIPVAASSEALAGSRAQAMLGELKTCEANRLVLLDLPPLLLTDDFMTIAAHLDGVVIVAREGRTKREDLTRLAEMLGPVRVLGTVLNHSAQFERRAY